MITVQEGDFLFDELSDVLNNLAEEQELLKQAEAEVKERKDRIRSSLDQYASMVGGQSDRVVFKLSAGDLERRLSGGKEVLNPDTLKEVIGEELYSQCLETRTEQVFSEKRLEELRRQGIITDEQVRQALETTEVRSSVYWTKRKVDNSGQDS